MYVHTDFVHMYIAKRPSFLLYRILVVPKMGTATLREQQTVTPFEALHYAPLYETRTYVHSKKAKFSHIRFYPQREVGISGQTRASIPK